ncbi:MAG TPA: sulfatase-like hydrolase/transferase [Bryobacteraceae bacterium]|jgi:arylsulfatase A-like enzyme|nr:sulfatase-like hydrolase/transferase [Bryobacteraceae bacterium]
MTFRWAWAGVLLWCTLLRCTVGAAQTPVIVISIDTLRADHLSAYGSRTVSTPNIDAFAQHGTLFSNVNSQIPLTLPSHTSLFTSTYPFQNGVEENGEVVPTGAVTLATVLQSHGYKTAAFIGSSLLGRGAGLDRGFDDYDSPFGSSAAGAESPYSTRVRRDGALVLRAATQWLTTHKGQPAFVFIHLFDLHAPYKLHSVPGSALPEIVGYDAELRYVDQILGRFRQTLEQQGWWQQSLVVLLADHGESLGEHGESSHGYFAYESTLHVPLMVHWPESSPAFPARATKAAGLIDIAPTILDALHLPAQPSFEGTSLMRFDESPEHAVYSESVYARDQFRCAPLRVLRIGKWKLIATPRAELYDLEKDPRELSNILRMNSAEVTTLRTELSKLITRYAQNAQAPTPDTSPGARKALESLGYLAGGQNGNAVSNGPDPKDKLPEYLLYEKALDAFYAHRLDAAVAGLNRLLAQDPGNLPARGTLGQVYFSAGKPEAAVREWKVALARDPNFAPAADALAEYEKLNRTK